MVLNLDSSVRRAMCFVHRYRIGAISIGLALFTLCPTDTWAQPLPTLARLSCRMPPHRMAKFDTAFAQRCAPILKRYGLNDPVSAPEAMPDSIFSRYYALNEPGDVARVRGALQGDPEWETALRELGKAFASSGSDGLLPLHFAIYTSLAGPGTRTLAGPGSRRRVGKGTVRWQNFDLEDGFRGSRVRSILQDSQGGLWFSTDGSGVIRYDGIQFVTVGVKDGLASDWCYSSLEDPDGLIWIATNEGISRYDPAAGEGPGAWSTITPEDGLGHHWVWHLFQDREGNIWAGTIDGGVSVFDGETWTSFTTEDGLADNSVFSIEQDESGRIWVSTYGGGCQPV
jgi:hypothetical protein